MKEVTNIDNWGDSGENGTMYDGLNLFDFYVSDEVTGQMESFIRQEYDLNDQIHIQEVYLGFYEHNNKIYFISGWDMLVDTKIIAEIQSCLLHFEIEDSEIKKLEITEDSYKIFYEEMFKCFDKTFTHVRLD